MLGRNEPSPRTESENRGGCALPRMALPGEEAACGGVGRGQALSPECATLRKRGALRRRKGGSQWLLGCCEVQGEEEPAESSPGLVEAWLLLEESTGRSEARL